jgi:hypothetical protein
MTTDPNQPGHTCVDQPTQPCAVAECMSPALREHLRWSWNFGIAEGLQEDSIKEVARQISGGIVRGEDVPDEDLLVDFNELRVYDGEICEVWLPEAENMAEELRGRLKKLEVSSADESV